VNIWKVLSDEWIADKSFYTVMLLYSDCANAPGGCPPGIQKAVATAAAATLQPTRRPTLIPEGNCPAPQVVPGSNTGTAVVLDPDFPIVVGQDPDKRGVDLLFSLVITPTLYHTWQWEQVSERTCLLPDYTLETCPLGYLHGEDEYECVRHTASFCEAATSVTSFMKLAESSRDWILEDLQFVYPGAYLHKPEWRWNDGTGGCRGATYQWRLELPHTQIEDPGYYDIPLVGQTAGTPVTAPRSFNLKAGRFGAGLIQTTIIR